MPLTLMTSIDAQFSSFSAHTITDGDVIDRSEERVLTSANTLHSSSFINCCSFFHEYAG